MWIYEETHIEYLFIHIHSVSVQHIVSNICTGPSEMFIHFNKMSTISKAHILKKAENQWNPACL